MSKGLIRFVSTQCSTHVYRTDLTSADSLLVHIHVYTGLLANAFVLEDWKLKHAVEQLSDVHTDVHTDARCEEDELSSWRHSISHVRIQQEFNKVYSVIFFLILPFSLSYGLVFSFSFMNLTKRA